MEFTWNLEKSERNKEKHGISFETASLVFQDPYHLSKLDRVVDGEERWQTIGRAGQAVILLVAHTCRGDEDDERGRADHLRRQSDAERAQDL